MELISKNKFKDLNKLLTSKERNKRKLFLVFDETSINIAKKLNLLKEAYKSKDGVIGVVKFLPNKPLGNKVIYLDEISDPTNLGKIILLMNKYHIKDLILSPKSVSIYNEKCLEVAKEKIFNLNISYLDTDELKLLKKDYQIIATGLNSTNYLKSFKPKNKYILVFGNEARGVNSKILKFADEILKIEIANIDSLNVSVAVSIIFNNLN